MGMATLFRNRDGRRPGRRRDPGPERTHLRLRREPGPYLAVLEPRRSSRSQDPTELFAWTLQNRIGIVLAMAAILGLAFVRANRRERMLGADGQSAELARKSSPAAPIAAQPTPRSPRRSTAQTPGPGNRRLRLRLPPNQPSRSPRRLPPNQPSRSPRRSTAQTPGPFAAKSTGSGRGSAPQPEKAAPPASRATVRTGAGRAARALVTTGVDAGRTPAGMPNGAPLG